MRLVDALAAVTGNLGVPGGGATYYFQRRGRVRHVVHPEAGEQGARTLLEPLLGEEILRADPKVRVAVIDNANPASQLPESATVARALASVDFLVVIDAFLTDTAELAHVVLPTTTMLEEHDVVGAYGHHSRSSRSPWCRRRRGCDRIWRSTRRSPIASASGRRCAGTPSSGSIASSRPWPIAG